MPELLDARLTGCFTVVFPQLDPKDVSRATMDSVTGWDSVATVTLVNVVEEEFGMQIDLDDVEHLVSFEQFRDYLSTRQVKTT